MKKQAEVYSFNDTSAFKAFLPFEMFCQATQARYGLLPEEMLQWFSPRSEQGLRLRLFFATEYLKARTFGKALAVLLPLTEMHARQVSVWVLLALVWRGLGQHELAEKAAKRARARQPKLDLLDQYFPLPTSPNRPTLIKTEPEIDNSPMACLAREELVRMFAERMRKGEGQASNVQALIVIPFYGHPTVLKRLLESLKCSLKKNRVTTKVVVIDDASPWQRKSPKPKNNLHADERFSDSLSQEVRNFAESSGFIWLRNPRRGGFIGAANLGFNLQQQLNASPHLLLLNSDCVAPNANWLDRMMLHLKRQARLGSLMPFSNAAEFASLPEPGLDNPLPTQEVIDATDRAAQGVHDNELVRCPGAIGFCWLIRNTLVRSLKGLDTKAFQSGYGEDTDFCARASELGFWHGLAADVFVGHEGSASYGQTQKAELVKANARVLAQRYPGLEDIYESWAYTDPLRIWRERILRAQAVLL
jgi:GT2 family glycosyltransferase